MHISEIPSYAEYTFPYPLSHHRYIRNRNHPISYRKMFQYPPYRNHVLTLKKNDHLYGLIRYLIFEAEMEDERIKACDYAQNTVFYQITHSIFTEKFRRKAPSIPVWFFVRNKGRKALKWPSAQFNYHRSLLKNLNLQSFLHTALLSYAAFSLSEMFLIFFDQSYEFAYMNTAV